MRFRAAILAAMLLPSVPLAAQRQAVVAGRVVVAGETDSAAAPGARITLHRVASDTQGPVAAVTTDPAGRFRFRTVLPEGGVLLVSADWRGIEYFAPPVEEGRDVTVVVHDTSLAVPIRVAFRSVIVGGPAPDGTRDVIDLMVIRNPGVTTLVPADSLSPSFVALLPSNAANVVVADADFILGDADVHEDTMYVHAPIQPGDRQVMLQYQIPPSTRRFTVPLVPLVDTVAVLAEESDLRVGGDFVAAGSELIEGRFFSRWISGPATAVELSFPGRSEAPDWLVPAFLVLMAAGLGYLTWRGLLSPGRR